MNVLSGFLGVGLVVLASAMPSGDSRHLISQKNRKFAPREVTIRPGDTVVFQNDDLTDHHIMVRKGPSEFSSRLLQRGASYEVPFDEVGIWEIGCRIHPRMRMTIVSTDAPAAVTDDAEDDPSR